MAPSVASGTPFIGDFMRRVRHGFRVAVFQRVAVPALALFVGIGAAIAQSGDLRAQDNAPKQAPGDAAKESQRKADEFVEAAQAINGPAGNPECVWLGRRVVAYAHQGGAWEAPSSTIYAIERALDAGATALELDVHATADRRLVVCHDETVDRTTNGAGQICELTLAELGELDNAHWWAPGMGSPATCWR